MRPHVVSVARYEKPLDSVQKAVELAGGFSELPPRAKVFIKPNIFFWPSSGEMPLFGMFTTTRVIEDVVVLLKENGIDDITIGEGIMTMKPHDRATAARAFPALGFDRLKERYGIEYHNILERPFKEVDLGDGVALEFNADALESDYIINLPVLKTHGSTRITLGTKNLKGLLSVDSRKTCHNSNLAKGLEYHIARLADGLPATFTLADGIYTLERGPSFTGKARRSDILAASQDLLSLDMVGAKLLGFEPGQVRHLVSMAQEKGRPTDLSDIDLVGERIDDLASIHPYRIEPAPDGGFPTPVTGLKFRYYDDTMCTYCFALYPPFLMSILKGWNGEPYDSIEVLSGKIMKPDSEMKKTILIGDCMVKAYKDDPSIKETIPLRGCPPSVKTAAGALEQAGIDYDPAMLADESQICSFFSMQYLGQPEFDDSFFRARE